MHVPPARGVSLVELLVALVLLELLALGTLHATLLASRLARHQASVAATDIGRLEAVRLAASSPSCRDLPEPTLVPLALPAAPSRPAIVVQLRCGP